jgi:hypothetical protein
MSYHYDDEPGCPGCGVRDYGFDSPDVRSTLYVSNCRCKGGCVCTDEDRAGDFEPGECICVVNGCECDQTTIKVRINRIWDRECSHCGGVDWRPEWQVLKDDRVVATVPSEAAADAVVAAEYPDAEPPERDYAWESEAPLRRAEGWG